MNEDQQLAPVGIPRDVTRALASLDELSDDALMSLLETHTRLFRGYYNGAFVALAAFWVASRFFGLGWSGGVFNFALFICTAFAALGSRAYMKGEAARMGLSPKGLKEFYRRQRKLQWGSNRSDAKRRRRELRATPKQERLRVTLKHVRELGERGTTDRS